MNIKALIMIPFCLVLVACGANPSATTYSRDQALSVQQVQFGTITAIRPVQIAGTQSGVGAAAGTVVGGVAGSGIGDGRGSTIAAVVVGVAGGLLGNKIEQETTKKDGLEMTVQLDNGNIISVVQQAEELFQVGDRVRLLTSQGKARISH